MEGEWEGKRNHARMLLSEVSIPDLGSAQPTAHESHRHNRQAGSSSSLQCKRQRRPQRATQEQGLVGHIGRELGKSELSWI